MGEAILSPACVAASGKRQRSCWSENDSYNERY
jgi:hypothetical protein